VLLTRVGLPERVVGERRQVALSTRVSIVLEGDSALVRLKITDNGKGFLRQSAAGPAGSGWGLIIMRERADLVGGSFQLKTEPGAGTSIIIEIKEGS